MNIALIGYGKMGKEIESIALQRGHKIVLKIDVDNRSELTRSNLQQADVAIEFTTPDTAVANLEACFEAQVPVVCGSTGWQDKAASVQQSCQRQGGGLFYTSNFSIGVNIFFRLNQYLAQLINSNGKDYRATMCEIHHTAKKDAPSGTAISLANDIVARVDGLESWVNHDSDQAQQLPIISMRKDPAPGTHVVNYSSEVDEITICHEAKSRKGFALGAVLAAEFMQGKTGSYSMEDLLRF